MPRPANVSHLVFGGVLPGGEVWRSGIWLRGGSAVYDASTLAAIQANGTWPAFISALRTAMATTTNYSSMQLYVYDSPSQGAVAIYDAAPAAQAGTGAVTHPNQVALVLTLRTILATARGRGRMFLPGTGLATANGIYLAATVQAIVDAAAAMLSTLDTVVVSQTGGIMNSITACDADVIPDTQRGRRDSMTSARLTHAVT